MPMPNESMRAMRRWVLAPYAVDARLEMLGRTPADPGLPVRTRDANAWGVRFTSEQRLSEDAPARITLRAPDGGTLQASGSLAIVRHAPGGTWQASMVFDVEQTRLSAVRIDAANFAD